MKAALHGDARRPPETLSAFGKELRRFLERDDVMAILEDGDWGAGGCWILAEALARWLGPPAEIVAVGYPGIPVDHVAVKYADTYIDYRGAQSEREFMGNAATDRPGLIPKIRPFTKRLRRQAREWSIPCEPWQAGRLLSKLHQAFPETELSTSRRSLPDVGGHGLSPRSR